MNDLLELNAPYVNVLPNSMLGLEVDNKKMHSQEVFDMKDEKRRLEKMEKNTQILVKLEKQRKDQSKKQHQQIPESRAELICKQLIKPPISDNELDANAMIYSFQNFAHVLYCEKESDEEFGRKHPIDFNQKGLRQAIEDIKESCHKRQFFHDQSVPEPQMASSMWARMFSILESINAIESVFSQFRLLFHDDAGSHGFVCAEACRKVKNDYSECLPEEQFGCRVKMEECRRRCVASSFFDQFYVPIGFIRRNGLFKATCVTDSLCSEISAKVIREEPLDILSPEQEEERIAKPITEAEMDSLPPIVDQTRCLMDVQFLSIFELLHLAIASLEHLAILNPIPSKTVDELVREQEENDEQVKRKSRKQPVPEKSTLKTDLPGFETFESAPEKMLYRFKEAKETNAHSLAKQAYEVRARIKRKEGNRQREELNFQRTSEEEHDKRHAQMLDNLKECISLRDGFHDRFSDERIEIYRVFAKVNGASVRYSCFSTKKPILNNNLSPYDNPVNALRHYFPKDHEKMHRMKLLQEFLNFCNENKRALVGRQNFTFDESLTAYFVAVYFINTQQDDWLKNLSEQMIQQLTNHLTETLTNQTEVPNYRAWSATVLEQTDKWVKSLEKVIVKETQYWSIVKDGGVTTDHSSFASFEEFAAHMQQSAPWLFQKRDAQSSAYLFEHRQMQDSEDRVKCLEERRIMYDQFRTNCTRLWSVDSAIQYFNKYIFVQHDNYSDLDRKLQDCLISKLTNVDLYTLLENTRQEAVVQGQKNNTLWTVCCEPLLQGTADFFSNGEKDPCCEDIVFAANQKRDFNTNQFFQMQSYIWRLFRGAWTSTEHKVLPDVTKIGARVVEAFMRQSSIPFSASTDETYLLYDHVLAEEKDDIDIRKITARRIRNILFQAEQYLPAQQICMDQGFIKLVDDFNEPALEIAHNNVLALIGHTSSFLQERPFAPQLNNFTRPYLSLNSLFLYNGARNLERRKVKSDYYPPKNIRVSIKFAPTVPEQVPLTQKRKEQVSDEDQEIPFKKISTRNSIGKAEEVNKEQSLSSYYRQNGLKKSRKK